MSDCVFCRIAAGEIPATLVYQDDRVIGFRDLNPVAPIHVLLIPRRHISTLNDLAAGDEGLMGHLQLTAARLAKEFGFADTGYRTVLNCNAAAGQTVFHIHLHLLGGRELGWPPG